MEVHLSLTPRKVLLSAVIVDEEANLVIASAILPGGSSFAHD